MTTKPEEGHIEVLKLPRMLKSDMRPMEQCCGHHLLAHDALGCLITGCGCRKNALLPGRDGRSLGGRGLAAEGSRSRLSWAYDPLG